MFIEDLVLYICKVYRLISIVENIWLKRLVLQQCPWVPFPFRIILVDKMLPRMVQKTLDLHIFPNLASSTTISYHFDLSIFRDVTLQEKHVFSTAPCD